MSNVVNAFGIYGRQDYNFNIVFSFGIYGGGIAPQFSAAYGPIEFDVKEPVVYGPVTFRILVPIGPVAFNIVAPSVYGPIAFNVLNSRFCPVTFNVLNPIEYGPVEFHIVEPLVYGPVQFKVLLVNPLGPVTFEVQEELKTYLVQFNVLNSHRILYDVMFDILETFSPVTPAMILTAAPGGLAKEGRHRITCHVYQNGTFVGAASRGIISTDALPKSKYRVVLQNLGSYFPGVLLINAYDNGELVKTISYPSLQSSSEFWLYD